MINIRKCNTHFVFYFIFIINVYADVDTSWTKTFSGIDNDYGYSVRQTYDGGYIITGNTDSHGSGSTDIWLIKTNISGDTVWTKTFGGSDIDEGRCVRQIYDDFGIPAGYIITGYSNNYGMGSADVWLIKTDTIGDTIWTKTFGGNDFDWSGSVQQTTDGGYIITGGTFSYGAGDHDAWLIKIDALGDTIWTKTFGGSALDWSGSVQQTIDGGYIIIGGTYSYGAGNHDIWLIKTDSMGNTSWTRTFGGVGEDWGESIQQTTDGGYIIAGNTYSYAVGGCDIWLIKTDSNGNQEWSQTFGGSNWEMSYSAQQTTDSGYIITGYSESYYGAGDADIWLIKTDNQGEMNWTRIYGEIGDYKSRLVQQTTDGGYIITGHAQADGTGLRDLLLIKVAVTPNSIIISDSIWVDENWDGFASQTLDGSSSYHSDGLTITDYLWLVDGVTYGTEPTIQLTLPTGSHRITLKVTDTNGVSDSTETEIHVFSSTLETGGPITSAVSTIGDTIFFTSSTDDRVYNFNSSGDILWFLYTGGDVQSTTTIGPNNNIYVGSSDTRLYSFNISGNYVWDLPMGGIVTASPAITPEGILYIGVNNHRLYSVNSDDGSINWNFLTGGAITSSAIVLENGDVLFGSDDSRLYSVNPAGNNNWFYQTLGPVKSTPALDTLGNIYFGSDGGQLYSITNNSELIWSFETNSPIRSSPVLDSNGNIYFGSGDSSVYALDSDGNQIWQYNSDSPVYGSPAIGSNGNIYIGSENGKILALNSIGELEWYLQTGGPVVSPPLVTNSGRIYIGSSDGKLYGFVEPEYGLAKTQDISGSQWPTFQGNNRRTGYHGDVSLGITQNEMKMLPEIFYLSQNYPNPFNPVTTISYQLPKYAHVNLSIYDIAGRWVETIVFEYKAPGSYSVKWNAENVGSGLYFYQLEAGDYTETKKCLVLK